jgi:hypothetical protein
LVYGFGNSLFAEHKQTNAEVETAHRATTLCHLVSICRLLARKLK